MSSLLQTYLRFRPSFFHSFSPFIQRVNAKNSSNKLNRGKITRVSRTSARKKTYLTFAHSKLNRKSSRFPPFGRLLKPKGEEENVNVNLKQQIELTETLVKLGVPPPPPTKPSSSLTKGEKIMTGKNVVFLAQLLLLVLKS